MNELSGRWPATLAAHTDLRDRLLEAYAEPHRRYHDTRHLHEVLGRLTTLLTQPEAQGVDGDVVVLAAWFHDAVYDGQRDDEERSALLAETSLTAAGVSPATAAEVARLVRLTQEHRADTGDCAGQILCDADLGILAADRARYEEYTRAVREEFGHLDEQTFRSGRTEVLRHLLEGPLFHTAFARKEWEAAARTNVERELRALDGVG